MKWTQVPAGDINAANQRLWVALGDNADTVANRINSEPDYLERIAGLMITGGFNPTTSQQRAREIMGHNFFGIEEAIKHFKVNPSEEEIATLAEIRTPEGCLITEEEMLVNNDTHTLVAVFPMPILDIRDNVAHKHFRFHEDAWYDHYPFANEPGNIGCHLVRKTPVPDSTLKNYDEQQILLDENEETPSAQVMVYTIIGHYLATGKRLFEDIYVRTSSFSDGRRVIVGKFDSGGLRVDDHWDEHRYHNLGLSASRNFEP